MTDKVLIYSRFPKTMMARFAERFELLDTGGKPAREMFSADELGGIRAVLTAGGTPLARRRWTCFRSSAPSSATALAMTVLT
jgi:hydroxypyruvate reductase